MHPHMYALRNRVVRAPDDGSGAGAGGGITNDAGAGGFDFNKSIWDNNSAGGGGAGAGGTDGNSQTGGSNGGNADGNSGTSGAGDAMSRMNAHIESKNFVNGVDFNKLAEGGDPEAIKASFNNLTRNMYVGMMADVNRIVEARVEQAVEKAVKTAKSEVYGTQAVDDMFRSLPHLNNPNTAPVAQSVFAKFIEKGQTREMAVRNTDKYFKDMAANILGVNPDNRGRPSGSPRGGSGNSDMSGGGSSNQPSDWMNFLTQ